MIQVILKLHNPSEKTFVSMLTASHGEIRFMHHHITKCSSCWCKIIHLDYCLAALLVWESETFLGRLQLEI